MHVKSWIKISLLLFLFCSLSVIGINYFVNPYGIYSRPILSLSKIIDSNKMSLIKISKVQELKPKSIILGTSRAEFGYSPEHSFFLQPSFNFATAGSSLYENKRNLEWAISQGNLKQVLLVADYRMFISLKMKQIPEFDDYFSVGYKYKLLFNLQTFRDSLKVFFNKGYLNSYLDNGQRNEEFFKKRLIERGGTLSSIKRHYTHAFQNYKKEYKYQDSKLKSFEDFKEIIEQCYNNNIELTIVLGPNHVDLWESLDNTLGFDSWLQWKKDVLYSLEDISKRLKNKSFKVVDFSIYNEYTQENKTNDMKFHYELVHYKKNLGDKVLNSLIHREDSIGIELIPKNIDNHLKQLKINRLKYLKNSRM